MLYPNTSAVAILFMRGVSSNIFVVPHSIVSNKRSEVNIFRPLLHVNKVLFCIAAAHIIIVSFIIQYELGKLEISTVLIFMNTGPIITVFAGGLLMKNAKLTWDVVAKVLVAFVGVLMIVLGKQKSSTDEISID